MDDPAEAVARIRRWLRPGGRFVRVDFLHDRFDDRSARWLAQVRGRLEATDQFPVTAASRPSPRRRPSASQWEWAREHVVEHQLNGSAEIEGAPGAAVPHPHPHLAPTGLGPPRWPRRRDQARERVTAELIADWEDALLVTDALSPVLMCVVATRDV